MEKNNNQDDCSSSDAYFLSYNVKEPHERCVDVGDVTFEDTSRSSSRIGGSVIARIQELETEQHQLSESLLSLSTKFAQVQFRIQQIAIAPSEQREEMLQQLQQFASRSCTNIRKLRQQQNDEDSNFSRNIIDVKEKKNDTDLDNAAQMRHLIEELRVQLGELENFAWQNGHLSAGDLPLAELRARQTLILERIRERMNLQVNLAGPDADADENEFRRKLDADLDEAERGFREKDQLVQQLSTQISDLERYVHLLQQEAVSFSDSQSDAQLNTLEKLNTPAQQLSNGDFNQLTRKTNGNWLARYFWPQAHHHFERNELKRSALGNHYGDQRAELELAVDEVVEVMRKHQILSVDREERAKLSIDELNKVVMECSHEAIIATIRKRLCPALRALLEHGLKDKLAPAENGSQMFVSGISMFSSRKKHKLNGGPTLKAGLDKIEGRKFDHVWDVVLLFLELSKLDKLHDAVIGNLNDTFKLETMEGSVIPQPTSKQILVSTIEYIINSHCRLHRSQDAQWKAFVCAALNRNRLPAWIRIIFRSEIVLSRCYNDWSYTARTGVEDIRPLLEGLQQFNFDLPVDLAVKPFESIKEAFG